MTVRLLEAWLRPCSAMTSAQPAWQVQARMSDHFHPLYLYSVSIAGRLDGYYFDQNSSFASDLISSNGTTPVRTTPNRS